MRKEFLCVLPLLSSLSFSFSRRLRSSVFPRNVHALIRSNAVLEQNKTLCVNKKPVF